VIGSFGTAAACLGRVKATALAAALVQPPFDEARRLLHTTCPRNVSPRLPWPLLAVDPCNLGPGLRRRRATGKAAAELHLVRVLLTQDAPRHRPTAPTTVIRIDTS
jgi:hypothetical protein